jgi:hypothetical protein
MKWTEAVMTKIKVQPQSLHKVKFIGGPGKNLNPAPPPPPIWYRSDTNSSAASSNSS